MFKFDAAINMLGISGLKKDLKDFNKKIMIEGEIQKYLKI